MKKTLIRNGRNLVSFVLAIVMMLSMTTNVFAGWVAYNSGTVYLEETWIENKQCINFYSGGQWKRNVAGEGNTLWIDSVPVLNNLYNTNYWCFDKYGNTWVINTSKNLLLCKAGTTTFVVNTVVSDCTGFQRDNGKVGYLVYTNNGSYSLDNLLNGNYGSYNGSGTTNVVNGNYTNETVSKAPYSYDELVTQDEGLYYYNYKGKELVFRYYDKTLYNKDFYAISSNVEKFGFSYGYVIFVENTKPSKVYQLPIDRNTNPKLLGSNFECFNYDNKGWISSVQVGNKIVNVGSTTSSNYDFDNSYNDYDDYPYVEKKGNYLYFYTSSNKYHKYLFSSSTLSYRGTNSSSSNITLFTNVDEVTFSPEGYIAFSVNDSYDRVYAYPVGKTSSSYKITIGKYFSHFDEYYDDFMSEGYYNTSGIHKSFSDYYDKKDNDDDYPYVEKKGNYLYFYTSSNKYHKYLVSGKTLSYRGTNSTSSNITLSTNVNEVTFSQKGYIAFSVNDSYDRVYAYPVGKTSSSYKITIGKYFSHFDEYYDDFMSEGYYDEDDEHIDFDF